MVSPAAAGAVSVVAAPAAEPIAMILAASTGVPLLVSPTASGLTVVVAAPAAVPIEVTFAAS